MMRRRTEISEYMRDIKKNQILTKEQEIELSKIIKSGNEEERNSAIEKLICSNLLLVVKIAYGYAEEGMSIQDLISEGNIGLMKAATKFDYTKGAKFSSYAAWWIRQTISRSIIRTRHTIRKPIPFVHVENKVLASANALESLLGRKPTIKEISDKTKISGKKVMDILRCSLSFFPMNETTSGSEQNSEIEFEDNFPSPLAMIENAEKEELMKEAFNSMSKKERKVIDMRFGMNTRKRYRLNEVGAKIGKSTERARQIEETALKKMRQYFNEMGYCGG